MDSAGIEAARLGPVDGGRPTLDSVRQYRVDNPIMRVGTAQSSAATFFTRRTVMRNRIAAVLLALPLLLVAATAYAGDGCCADKACCERCTDC